MEEKNIKYDCERGCTTERTPEGSLNCQYKTGCCKLEVFNWLDGIQQEDVRDIFEVRFKNTRKGFYKNTSGQLLRTGDFVVVEATNGHDLGCYLPLLLVKDFDSHGFTVDEQFMTNADVPTLALAGVVENPVNPFTGNPINSEAKTAREQYILAGTDFRTGEQDSYTFLPGEWFSVSDNIYERDNWKFWEKSLFPAPLSK